MGVKSFNLHNWYSYRKQTVRKKYSLLVFEYLCHVTAISDERGCPPKVYMTNSNASVDKYVLAKFFERV